jgi:hypothetical protein
MQRARGTRAIKEMLDMATPDLCCACRGKWGGASHHELEAIANQLGRMRYPENVDKYHTIAAKVCAECGHVMLLSEFKQWVVIWCPGIFVKRAPGRTLEVYGDRGCQGHP